MTKPSLPDLLARLRAELAAADSVDPKTRDLLGQLAADIHPLLEGRSPAPGAGPGGAPDAGLRDRLREKVLAFEASHPQLARAIATVLDTLAMDNL
jgi:hypothetical protein